MQIEIRKLTSCDLEAFGTVSIAFTSRTRLRVEWLDQGIGGIRLSEEPLPKPIFKDYDAERSVGPERWRLLHAISLRGSRRVLEKNRFSKIDEYALKMSKFKGEISYRFKLTKKEWEQSNSKQ